MKYIRWFFAWLVHLIGCGLWLVMEAWDNEKWIGFWYPICNWVLLKSSDIQGDMEIGPWSTINEQEE